MNIIIKASRFAISAHKDQYRKWSTNRPYWHHPARVAAMVAGATEDEDEVAAGWLHDVKEDSGVTSKQLESEFGSRVAKLVDELTNPSKNYPDLPRSDRKKMDREHLVTVSDSAKFIKCMDRLDNIWEMNDAPDEFKLVYGKESLLLADVLRNETYPRFEEGIVLSATLLMGGVRL